jgi:nitroreductase
MEVMEALLTRRSIRKYRPDPVPEDLVQKLLEAAMQAPSAGNQQPWYFVLIRERKTLDAIPTFHPHAAMLREAPLAILICANEKLEKHKGFLPLDCSAAAENLLLAAHALGLGAVWVSVYPREERTKGMRELLGIPSDVIPFALIPVGFPAEERSAENRFRANRVRKEHW